MKPLRLLLITFWITLSFHASGLFATDPTVRGLLPKWTGASAGYYLGVSTALSDKWAVLGSIEAKERGVREGAVQVFDAVTKVWKRKILPPLPVTPDRNFGASLAVNGDILYVGAIGEDTNSGAVYSYNLVTGAFLGRIVPDAADRNPGQQFGAKIAVAGTHLVVSAPSDGSSVGAAYLFTVNGTKTTYVAKLTDPDAASMDYFGQDIAIDGNILCISSRGDDSSRGSVSFFDLIRKERIVKHQPAGTAAGSGVGFFVSMHGGIAVFGSSAGRAFYYRPSTGAAGEFICPLVPAPTGYGFRAVVYDNLVVVYAATSPTTSVAFLFNAKTATSLGYIAIPFRGDDSPFYGPSLALNRNSLLVGSPGLDIATSISPAGGGYILSPLTAPMSYDVVTTMRDAVPGMAGVEFSKISEAFSSPQYRSIFVSSLNGPGSHGGKDTIAVRRDRTPVSITRLASSGQELAPDATILGTQFTILGNNEDQIVGLSSRVGAGIPVTDRVLWCNNGIETKTTIATGAAVPGLGGAKLLKFLELVQPNETSLERIGVVMSLKPETSSLTNLDNDTAVWTAQLPNSTNVDSHREGNPCLTLGGTALYGQISPRLCFFLHDPVFHCALRGVPTSANAAVFRMDSPTTPTILARKGTFVRDVLGALDAEMLYDTFLAESGNGRDSIAFKATMQNASGSIRDEGLWLSVAGGSTRLLLARGFPSLIAPNVRVAKVLQFWAVGTSSVSDQVVALVTLSGDGVNRFNDLALLTVTTDGNRTLLARKGDPVPGCGSARYASFNRIEVDGYSKSYAILATLSGASSSNNLALLTGDVSRGNVSNQSKLKQPVLSLRKGQLYSNQPSPIKSISIPSTSINAVGAGGTGRAHALAWDNTLTVIVDFANGLRQVVTRSL